MKVSVIGTGNVATRFAEIFRVTPISARTPKNIPSDSDLYIISVSDSALPEVATAFPDTDGIVVHTTGSVGMGALNNVKCKGFGVFYPLQTLSKTRPVGADEIPLMLEASDPDTMQTLKDIASDYGFTTVREADSDTRRMTHLAATFACNFVNALIGIGSDVMGRCGLDPADLHPLIKETIAKLDTMTPLEAQTGPAARNDNLTMQKHIEALEMLGMKEEEKLYRSISDIIRRNTQTKD